MSLVIGINPHNITILVVSDMLMDPVFVEILQEFSIGQGVIDTKKEPELGESGNRELENARIRGVVNLRSAMVWGGFFFVGCDGVGTCRGRSSRPGCSEVCTLVRLR